VNQDTFTIAVARQKVKKLYPDWKDAKENTDRPVE
jgi:hypothetical protein